MCRARTTTSTTTTTHSTLLERHSKTNGRQTRSSVHSRASTRQLSFYDRSAAPNYGALLTHIHSTIHTPMHSQTDGGDVDDQVHRHTSGVLLGTLARARDADDAKRDTLWHSLFNFLLTSLPECRAVICFGARLPASTVPCVSTKLQLLRALCGTRTRPYSVPGCWARTTVCMLYLM